jgi:thiol-disulfide isomerase/thioredoxin
MPLLLTAQGIKFEHCSMAEALQKARAQNKLIFIDGYATWCGPCKRMAKTVFLEKEVGDYFNEHFISLKIDVERGEGPYIKAKYGIEGLPGYVFIDADDNVVYRFAAAMPTKMFMSEVKKAVKNAKDPNSIGRLAERFKSEQNNEAFLRLYLDKLKENKSVDYTDILEKYLAIQTSVSESSKEMVLLLADHGAEIILGGKADAIIKRNLGSDAWKLYVRKDIRELYQELPGKMLTTTTNYAIAKKDTSILELTFDRAMDAGITVDENQRKRTYVYYYSQTGQGEKYKSMVRDNNEAFINSIDVERLRSVYQKWKKRKDAGDKEVQYTTPHAVKTSQNIAGMVYTYAKFAETQRDKDDVLRWMKVAYYIIPGDVKIMSQYATILYLFGTDKNEAITIMEKACSIAEKSNDKNMEGLKADLATMKKGGAIYLR